MGDNYPLRTSLHSHKLMNELNIGQQSSALPLLHSMQPRSPLSSASPRRLRTGPLPGIWGTLAQGFRDLLGSFTQLAGIMDEAVPWQPKGSASSK
jgi:hypothetical protein